MTTVFHQSGSVFTPASSADLHVINALPGGNYIIVKPPQGPLQLQQIEPFNLPPKMYGNMRQRADRILTTFHSRPNSTGVLLTGEKGSGKTQLAKLLGAIGHDQGMPCIVVNSAWEGDEFMRLIQSITQPCIVLFDEFEKTYDEDDQETILTLLDGVFPSKKLFILTCNDQWRINHHMKNRPGRIFYMLEYKGLDPAFITEYCEDVLQDKTQIEAIVAVASLYHQFNFDMLKALVEEMNRYGETAHQALEMLNAKPASDTGGRFNIALYKDGKVVPKDDYWPTDVRESPLALVDFQLTYTPRAAAQGDSIEETVAGLGLSKSKRPSKVKPNQNQVFSLNRDDLTHFDSATGAYVFKVREFVVKMTRHIPTDPNGNYLSLIV